MSIDVTSGNDLGLWHVQLGGSVRTMTLDELDQAFQSGVIDERTMVLKAGALHWTTLGDIAGIDDQPNSIAPMATDIASSNLVVASLPAPSFDVSLGTEELAVFRPKRRVGRALAAVAAVALVAGAVFGVKAYGAEKLQEKLASVTSLVKRDGGASARTAAGVPAPALDPSVVPAEHATPVTTPASLPSTPVESLPPAQPAAAAIVSIDSLPSAPPTAQKADKKHKRHGEAAPRRKAAPAKAKGKASSDPTQRGSGQFDPLNGSL